MILDDDTLVAGRRARQIVLIELVEILEDRFHSPRSHQREERINTLLIEVVRQSPQEQLAEGAAEAVRVRITLAVLEAPCCEIVRGEVVGEESVTTSQGDGVAEDGTADGVA